MFLSNDAIISFLLKETGGQEYKRYLKVEFKDLRTIRRENKTTQLHQPARHNRLRMEQN